MWSGNFKKIHFHWSIVVVHYCVSFCCTAKWISYSVQSLSCLWHFATPRTTAHQASLFITNSRSPPKPMSIESAMPSNHLILCHPLLLLPSIFPSIGVFSNESALLIRCSLMGSQLHPNLSCRLYFTSFYFFATILWTDWHMNAGSHPVLLFYGLIYDSWFLLNLSFLF